MDLMTLYTLIYNLSGNKKKIMLPEGFSDEVLAALFSDFFENKIENLIGGFVEEARFDLHQAIDRENRLNHLTTVDLIKVKSITCRVK